jgi:hypothetical protein
MNSHNFSQSTAPSTNLGMGVWITDQLFLPRYIWFKMKFELPMIREKIQFFNDIKNILSDIRILFNKGAARIKHLESLTKILKDQKGKIGQILFNNPNMEA